MFDILRRGLSGQGCSVLGNAEPRERARLYSKRPACKARTLSASRYILICPADIYRYISLRGRRTVGKFQSSLINVEWE